MISHESEFGGTWTIAAPAKLTVANTTITVTSDLNRSAGG